MAVENVSPSEDPQENEKMEQESNDQCAPSSNVQQELRESNSAKEAIVTEREVMNVVLPALPEENESSSEGMAVEQTKNGSQTRNEAGDHMLSIAENDNNQNQCMERSSRLTIVSSPAIPYIDAAAEEREVLPSNSCATPKQD
uniref:Uncharacterized protein n=1 Tax=Anopheles maculatus TaxID=74869 RepID=A0A182T226_9DIPT